MMKKKESSIVGQVNTATHLLTGILLGCMVINMILTVVSSLRYNSFINRMDTIATLKPVISSDILESVWSVVAGRSEFADCKAYSLIDDVSRQMDQILLENNEESMLELSVARRTMNTLQSYVEEIEEKMKNGAPIDESIKLVQTIREVGSLICNMLEGYMARKITFEAEYNRKMRVMLVFSSGIELILVACAVVMSSVMRRRVAMYIRSNLDRLSHFTGVIASGAFNARVPDTDVSEMKPLIVGLNTMADRLQGLIEQNIHEQEKLKKSELRTLQAQINPHFLYNTLDCIMWQAEEGHSEEVVRITCALSDFFRISLSSGEDWITLSQEAKHLEGYLAIQKARYHDILSYEVNISPDVLNTYILKLLLQPLVENALYHGIKFKRGGGMIRVTGEREGEMLSFRVDDTGCGMSPEQLQTVRESLHKDDAPVPGGEVGSSGFGLKNVDLRIRLYYHQNEGLKIESGPGGTSVSFQVPVLSAPLQGNTGENDKKAEGGTPVV